MSQMRGTYCYIAVIALVLDLEFLVWLFPLSSFGISEVVVMIVVQIRVTGVRVRVIICLCYYFISE